MNHSLSPTNRPRIARIWRGKVRTARADEYAAYLYEFGIRPLENTALGVQVFRDDQPEHTEFITISYWADVPSMSSFTGADPLVIHHLPRDPEFLIEMPLGVQILSVTTSSGDTGGGLP